MRESYSLDPFPNCNSFADADLFKIPLDQFRKRKSHASDTEGIAVISNSIQNSSLSCVSCNVDKIFSSNNNCNGLLNNEYGAHELSQAPLIHDSIPLLQKKRWKSLETISAFEKSSSNGDAHNKKSLGRSSIKWLFGIFQSNGFRTSSNTSLKKNAVVTGDNSTTGSLLQTSTRPEKESIV